jgi:phage FluMu protein Com
MGRKVMCPICNRRVFDIKERASGEIEMKCPHCRNIISIPLNSKLNK